MPGPARALAAWEAELDEALTLAGEHLSLYQLTIEPGTAFGNRAARGEVLAADEETGAALFEATQLRLAAAGLPAYEISNHARPGAECRHNLAYWRYDDYLGIGPGAHGRVTQGGGKIATRQLRAPEAWLAAIENSGTAIDEMTPIAPRGGGRRDADDGAAPRRRRRAPAPRSLGRARCRGIVRRRPAEARRRRVPHPRCRPSRRHRRRTPAPQRGARRAAAAENGEITAAVSDGARETISQAKNPGSSAAPG